MAKGRDYRDYLEALGKSYEKNGMKSQWEHLMEIAEGVSPADRAALLAEYPELPLALLGLLERIDGTYYRQYKGEEVCYFFFGSDVEDGKYPYYLLSAREMLEHRDCGQYFADLVYYARSDPDPRYGPVWDPRIETDDSKRKLLHFADCMNNGGSSSLYIDFAPAEGGKKGQILRYLHDPDELQVIADSLDEFLETAV